MKIHDILNADILNMIEETIKLSIRLNAISNMQIELSYGTDILKVSYRNGDGLYTGEIKLSADEATDNLFDLLQEFRRLWTASYYELTYHFSPNKYKKFNESKNPLSNVG